MHPDEKPSDDDAEVIRTLVASAALEVIPMRSAEEKLQQVPTGTTITVTCSSKFGLDATLALAATAAARGHRVIPHLAARQIVDEAELGRIVETLVSTGIEDLFVIGGDAPDPAGEFASSAELLEALARSGHTIRSVGVGCYPEGHPQIADDVLVADLLRKQELAATYMVSQLCFHAGSLVDWVQRIRAAGVRLPLSLGLAAPLKTRKLVELSLRIGVGSSIKFLTHQRGFVGNLLVGNTYRPEHLLDEIGDDLTSDDLGIKGLHLFSFNQVAATIAWQREVDGSAPIELRP
ncbi:MULTISPECIES: methylenetetrahydrofolate reductase [unclassified Mycobacterium]|uniref:methylenetetrahydrofolate reductase n=1 Tax=unclassified Mycobacterium TaxID=2642494 RepID=UPI0029C636BB|nr:MULTISPECIES: methylenetetrahydrofolate reductase [unclassified Mycobacterium]